MQGPTHDYELAILLISSLPEHQKVGSLGLNPPSAATKRIIAALIPAVIQCVRQEVSAFPEIIASGSSQSTTKLGTKVV